MSVIEVVELPVAEGLTFTARVAGPVDGRPVLLLHGFPQSSWSWRHQLASLAAAGFRAVAPDQRGYSPGARPVDVAAYGTEHLVGDVLAIADHLGWTTFDLVGHDWGAAVAWQVAGRHPDRLRTLSILSVPHPRAFTAALRGDTAGAPPAGGEAPDDQSQRSWYMTWFQTPDVPEQTFLADDAAALRGMYLPGEDPSPYVDLLTQPGALTGAINWYRAATIGDGDGMGPITTPCLYVWSTEDTALGRTGAEATAKHVDGPYRFEVLEGISHWVPEEAPDALDGLLLEHLATA